MRRIASRNWRTALGLLIFGLFALTAVVGPPLVSSFLGLSPHAIYYDALGSPPSLAHPLGTTNGGQDVFAQLVAGTRTSMAVGLLAGFTVTLIAVVVGVTAGYYGGWVDNLLNTLSNIFIVMPAFPLLLVIASYLQNAGIVVIALTIGLVGWAGGARTIRSQTLSARNRDYVTAAALIGERRSWVVATEVLPQLAGLAASMFLGGLIYGILSEAGLAFLGISDQNVVSWGGMLLGAQQQGALLQGMWWWFIPPGMCIAVVGLAAGLVNFGVDEAANPKLRTVSARQMRSVAKAFQLAQDPEKTPTQQGKR